MRLVGLRYVWVDCLCLVQDDGDDMADGIAKMDLVYRGARATIIAATGTDANAGLLGHLLIIWVFRFQEQVLSIRSIVFTEDRAFFRCNENIWGEDIIFDKFPKVKNQSYESGNSIPTMSYSNADCRSAVDKYMRLLFRYHGRDLTNEDDSN